MNLFSHFPILMIYLINQMPSNMLKFWMIKINGTSINLKKEFKDNKK